MERDVRLLRDIGDPHHFTRLTRLIVALSAQELNASHLGREIGIAPRTARAWLDALVGSYQVLLLDAWSGNTVKRVSARPKIHVLDTGLAAWLLSVSSAEALGGHPRLGALFESHVVGELVKQASAMTTPPRFWHWRSVGGAEVDLLVERDGRFHPIEIKLASHVTRRDATGMTAFFAAYPALNFGAGVIVYGGGEVQRVDERIVAVPVGAL